MTKNKRHSREEIKEMAIIAASELICELGIENCSTRKIADKISYTVGTLYNVFDNYDDIIMHVNARTYDKISNFLTTHIGKLPDGVDKTKHLAALYIIFIEQNTELWTALTRHKYADDMIYPSWYLDAAGNMLNVIKDTILQNMPDVPDENAVNAANVIWASLRGISTLGAESRDFAANVTTDDTQKYIHSLIENLVDNYISGLSS